MRQINQNILKIKDPTTGEFKTIPNLMIDNSTKTVSGVEVGPTEPKDPYTDVWIDTTEDSQSYKIPQVNDSKVSSDDTWSSRKIQEVVNSTSKISDESISTDSTWSSSKISNSLPKRQLLWENVEGVALPSGTEIELSSDDYDVLEFYLSSTAGAAKVLYTQAPRGYSTKCDSVEWGSQLQVVCRSITYISDTRYSVGDLWCLIRESDSKVTSSMLTDSTYCTPFRIYGIKY